METISTLDIASPAFANNGLIPEKYTCEGLGINPPLTIHNIPENTLSLALIIDDPDAPGQAFTHWVLWNIPPAEGIEENSAPGITGRNSLKENKYFGPCPPRGTHRYYFKVYALNTNLGLPESTDQGGLLGAMKDHVLAQGELIGLYRKKTNAGREERK